MSAVEETCIKPKKVLPIRHVQAVLLFLSLVITFGMKTNMGIAIVAMMDPKQKNYFQWDTKIQSIVLSSFFWGYLVLQIPGGILAGKYGGKLVITICVAINSAVSVITPIGASYGGWKLVCACRVIQGLFQGSIIPSVHSLIGSWAPVEEKSRFSTFIYAGCHLGTALQLITSGFIADSWGWQGIFYTNGILGIFWTMVYIFLGSSSPHQSKMISSEEKLYIQNSLGQIGGKKKLRTPWKKIWLSPPFLSLIVVHCGEAWGFWTLAMEIPSYMSQVLGVNIKENGMMSALPYILIYLVSFPLGFTSDYIIKKKWLSVTACRKVSNSIGHFGPALALVSMACVPTGSAAVAVTVLTLTVVLNAGYYTGFNLVHIDMAPEIAGALMGVTNFVSNTISLFAPLVAGAILQDQKNANDWQKLFYLTAAVYAVGNLTFIIFGSSERQKWNDIEDFPATDIGPRKSELNGADTTSNTRNSPG